MGQGGAMAIEDGASLGAFLPLGTTRADVPSRLQLYEKCRKERVETIQDFTRRSGRNNDGIEGPRPNGKLGSDFISPFWVRSNWEILCSQGNCKLRTFLCRT
jgi:salicylate hydroxylase